METKTNVRAEDGKQDLHISRDFDLPLDLLFTAFEDPEIIAQWMGTNVLKLESRKHGSFQFETRDPKGNVAFQANGVIHEFIPRQKITRTFEMQNAPFGVQLEVYNFESLDAEKSRLRVHVIYETPALRDQLLRMPFAQGLNMAHNRLEEILSKMK